MKIHQLPLDVALASLRSSSAGLLSSEAERRRREYGANRVEQVARQPAAWRLLKEFTRFFSVILWCAAALAFMAEWFDPGQGMSRIGYAVIAVILVSGLFSFWQEYRIEQTLAALQKLLPQRASALRDGIIAQLPAEEIVVGDVIILEAGNNVPADCRLIEGFGLVSTMRLLPENPFQKRSTQPRPYRRNWSIAETYCWPELPSSQETGARWCSLPDRSRNLAGSLTFPRPVVQ
jgi:sodium/potassium-transporting ATPase subunit alpha